MDSNDNFEDVKTEKKEDLTLPRLNSRTRASTA